MSHLVVSGGGEYFLEAVLGLVLGELTVLVLEEPYGDDRLGVYGEGDLVDFLIYGNQRLISRCCRGCLVLRGMFDELLGAGEDHEGGRENIC